MIAWMAWAACSYAPDKPKGVPENAAHFWLRDGNLMIDDTQVAPLSSVDADPLEDKDPSLVASLSVGSGPLWVELPKDTPFHILRRVLNSAGAAERAPLWVSNAGADNAHEMVVPPSYGLGGSCSNGKYPVQGVRPLITISIQTGRDGSWLLGSARFLPVVERFGEVSPVDGLPSDCLDVPPCDVLFAGQPALVNACHEGEASAGAARVSLGGPTGCLSRIAAEPAEVSRWEEGAEAFVKALALGDQPLVMVMPEARVRLDSISALLDGFESGGAGVPAIGTTLLIEGNDGPPMCTAPVRDADSLAQAGARWAGGARSAASASKTEGSR